MGLILKSVFFYRTSWEFIRSLQAGHGRHTLIAIVDADISSLRKRSLNNPAQRDICGFTTRVPSRSIFSRVFGQLGEMREELEELLKETSGKLCEYMPDLGREVALDSTMIETDSNPNRTPVSAPDTGVRV